MSNESKSIWIVFNGEVYNFPHLKCRLEGLGHVFRTKSDTEVILHGYEEWGIDCFAQLNGMFGLAIWDSERRRLVLARDRLGIKFIYYRIDEDGLSFASEIRGLRSMESAASEIAPVALYQFLRFRYTPSPLTIYRDIRKLAPGTCLVADETGTTIRRWWESRPSPSRSKTTFGEAVETLADLYEKAVQRHLLSDVPVGILLSGGIDSALLLALMRKAGYLPRTYTVGYGSQYANDELELAKETAAVLGAPNEAVLIDRPTFERDLGAIVSCIEEPITSASIVPMYHVCQRAHMDLKVAFIGQGPDELMAGYRRHVGIRYGWMWRDMPKAPRTLLKGLLSLLPRSEAVKRGAYSLETQDRLERYIRVFSLAEHREIAGLFQKDYLPDDVEDSLHHTWKDLVPLMDETDELGGFQFLELRASLPDELLMYADKLSMAHSLELRVPYLDHTIVEYVESLPASFKLQFGKGKLLHRAICRRYLPREILNRPKLGFAADIVDQWYRDSVSSKIVDCLNGGDSLMYKYLRPKAVRQLLTEHQKGIADHHKLLFSLTVFEEWLRKAA